MTPFVQQFGEQQVAGFFLVLARLSPLFVLAPLFSSQLLPARVRGIVAVALTIGRRGPDPALAEPPLDHTSAKAAM